MNKRGQSFFKQKLKTKDVVSAKRWLLIRSTLQVMLETLFWWLATLIVAVTFQAALNPPAGVWQEDRYDPKENCTVVPANLNKCTRLAQAGISVLHTRSKIRYGIFIFVNTMAFSAATSAIFCLLRGSPLQTETLISIYCMNSAYVASVGAVQPQTPTTWTLLFVALLSPYIFRLFINIIKRHKVAREQDLPQGPPVFQRGACLDII